MRLRHRSRAHPAADFQGDGAPETEKEDSVAFLPDSILPSIDAVLKFHHSAAGKVFLVGFYDRVKTCMALPVLLIAGASFGSGGSTVCLDSCWHFLFAGQDSGISFSQYDPSRKCTGVTLPHVFYQENAARPPATGFGWYYRNIEIPKAFKGKDVFLEFEGVALRSMVYLEGKKAGESAFAYLPFRVSCAPFIQGKTEIRCAVRVDSRFLRHQIPDPNAKGWWKYGGMIRGVHLCAFQHDRIDSVQVRTFYHAGDTFGLHLILKPAQLMWDSVVVTIAEIGGKRMQQKTVTRGTDMLIRTGGLQGWTPEAPVRYSLLVVPFFKGKPGDTLRMLKGFCQLEARKANLYLNGRPYYLRGMGRHDVIDEKGPLLTRNDRLKDLEDLKSLGVNFLRIAHFPQHRDVYELCDSLGILVMDEIPLWKTGSRFLGSQKGIDFGSGYMKNLVAVHGNYTSVCMWSLGNQFGSYQSSVAGYVDAVAVAVKKADPSRLVTFCSYYYIWDKAFSPVDVISINEYFGWELASSGMLGPMLDGIHKDWPDKPVIVSELGAQSSLGLRNPHARLAGAIKSIYYKDLSEDHQSLFIGAHMDTIWSKRSFVIGMVVWAYADYMTCQNKARTAEMPAGLNACGIVTQDRKRKLSYEVVKEHYSSFSRQFSIRDSLSP